jgi:hypothetical protein
VKRGDMRKYVQIKLNGEEQGVALAQWINVLCRLELEDGEMHMNWGIMGMTLRIYKEPTFLDVVEEGNGTWAVVDEHFNAVSSGIVSKQRATVEKS